MSAVSVEVKRTGFPVTIGTYEMWFSTATEDLARYFDMEEEATKRLNAYQKEIIATGFDKEIKPEDVKKDTVLGAIELEKKFIEIQYDLLFGDGTFAALYELYPDYEALNNTLEVVCKLIEDKLEELAIERADKAAKRIAGYTKKTTTAKQKKKQRADR